MENNISDKNPTTNNKLFPKRLSITNTKTVCYNINKHKSNSKDPPIFLPMILRTNILPNPKVNTSSEIYNKIYSGCIAKKIVKINDNIYKRLLGSKGSYIFPEISQNTNIFNTPLPESILTSHKQTKPSKTSEDQSHDNNIRILRNINNTKSITTSLKESKSSSDIFTTSHPLLQTSNTSTIQSPISQQILPKPKPKKDFKYGYCVLPGNNSKLIISCMNTRPQWELCDSFLHSYASLYWTPLSSNINYLEQEHINAQYINHIENHYELSNKMNLFINLLRYCESSNTNLFSFFPLTIIFPLSHDSFYEQLRKFISFYKEYPTQQINHNTYNYYFTTQFYKNIGTIQKMTLPSSHYAGNNIWLLKPINLNRGRYIKIVNNVDIISKELLNLHYYKTLSLSDKKKSKCKGKTDYILLQKYIEKPLTYKNRKFDIRIWVMFTYKEDVYVFKEGHLKASSSCYDLNSNDLYVHLTNYSVQKHNMNFSKEEIGNEISFEEFQKELDKDEKGICFRKDVLPKIYEIIRITFKAVRKKLMFSGRRKCFEIFGYDFLIDCEYNPFLIEINTNPGLEESSPLIKMLVPRMVDDALRLTIDEEYIRDDINDIYRECSMFKVNGYSDYENMWIKLKR